MFASAFCLIRCDGGSPAIQIVNTDLHVRKRILLDKMRWQIACNSSMPLFPNCAIVICNVQRDVDEAPSIRESLHISEHDNPRTSFNRFILQNVKQ